MKNNLPKLSAAALITLFAFAVGCKKNGTEELSGPQNETLAVQDATLYGSRAACDPNAKISISGKDIFETKKSAVQTNVIYDTDFLSAGVGGTRGVGTGKITLPNEFDPEDVTLAYLYWHGVTNSSEDVGKTITVNSKKVTGTSIGVSASNCWPFTNSQGYRADVTNLVKEDGSGDYELSDFGELDPNGASLIVFHNDNNNANNRDVVIFDGNDSNINFAGFPANPNAPADPAGWNVLLSGIQYTSGKANIELHVGDGQPFLDDGLFINTQELVPSGEVFQGNSVPGGLLWDIKKYDVTSFLNPGTNSLNLTTGTVSDCLSLIVAMIDLPAGAAPQVDAFFDFDPGVCPNIFKCSAKGSVNAAILGTQDLDVTKIDASSIRLNGVAPTSSSVKDVATPFTQKLVDCTSCNKKGPDQKNDLLLVFDIQAIAKTLGNTADKECIKIKVTGKLKSAFGGTGFETADYIQIDK